jgi:hypothetical protein
MPEHAVNSRVPAHRSALMIEKEHRGILKTLDEQRDPRFRFAYAAILWSISVSRVAIRLCHGRLPTAMQNDSPSLFVRRDGCEDRFEREPPAPFWSSHVVGTVASAPEHGSRLGGWPSGGPGRSFRHGARGARAFSPAMWNVRKENEGGRDLL